MTSRLRRKWPDIVVVKRKAPSGAFFVLRVFLVLGVYPFFGDGELGFRPYGGSLLQTPKSNQNAVFLTFGPRCGSGSFAPGSIRGASPPVCCAAPPLDAFGFAKRSLRSHPRMNPSTQPSDVARASRSKAAAELTLILLSGGEQRRGAVGVALAFAFLVRVCSRKQAASRPIPTSCTQSLWEILWLRGSPQPTFGWYSSSPFNSANTTRASLRARITRACVVLSPRPLCFS